MALTKLANNALLPGTGDINLQVIPAGHTVALEVETVDGWQAMQAFHVTAESVTLSRGDGESWRVVYEDGASESAVYVNGA